MQESFTFFHMRRLTSPLVALTLRLEKQPLTLPIVAMVPQPPSPSVWRGRKGRYEAQTQMPHHNRWCWFKGVLPFHALEPNPIHDKGRSKAVSLCCAKILVKPLGFLPWVLFLSLSLLCIFSLRSLAPSEKRTTHRCCGDSKNTNCHFL